MKPSKWRIAKAVQRKAVKILHIENGLYTGLKNGQIGHRLDILHHLLHIFIGRNGIYHSVDSIRSTGGKLNE